ILITHRKVDHWFRNEITGALIGRLVQTYYNLDDLSSIVIKPTNDPREAYVIPSEVVIPTGTASAEQSQAANASVEAQNRPARTLYKTIAPHIPQNGPERFRRQIVSPEFAEDQADIAAQQEAIRQQQSQTRRTQRKINRLERSHGVTPHSAVSDERRLAGLQLLQESNQDANA
ncbi:MAG: hypothetical protein KIT44_14385, partial [Opitutaceae bacterium]|nr:hypothetical protein [Opitutaceae bacterium]